MQVKPPSKCLKENEAYADFFLIFRLDRFGKSLYQLRMGFMLLKF